MLNDIHATILVLLYIHVYCIYIGVYDRCWQSFEINNPNFGNVSAAQQIGRVNFIENVKSGGNLLNTRTAFDQHGGNIQIGKITNP